MGLGAWIIIAASLSFSAGVALTAYALGPLTVSKSLYNAALRQIEKQQDTIDRLLARQFERLTGEDAQRFQQQLGKLVRDKPGEKPE